MVGMHVFLLVPRVYQRQVVQGFLEQREDVFVGILTRQEGVMVSHKVPCDPVAFHSVQKGTCRHRFVVVVVVVV